MKNQYYIGIEESYENRDGGILIVNFFIVQTEQVYEVLCLDIKKLSASRGIKEIKNHNSNNKFRQQVFDALEGVNFQNYFYKSILKSTKDILFEYKKAIKLFTEFLSNKADQGMSTTKYEIEIDRIGSFQFQFECTKLFRLAFQGRSIKHTARFLDSQKSTLIQISDIFAGEIRRSELGISKFEKYLTKNKNSIL